MAEQTAEKISYEDFLRLYDGQYAEWENGEVTLMSPLSIAHMRLSNFLQVLFFHFLITNPIGDLLSAPFTMRISHNYSPEPDLMFVRNEHKDRIQRTGLEGAADVVIEIISPESDDRDRHKKYSAYQAGGVGEYWLLNPASDTAFFCRLAQNNHFELVALDEQGYFHSVSIPGFKLPVNVLWSVPELSAAQIMDIVQSILNS